MARRYADLISIEEDREFICQFILLLQITLFEGPPCILRRLWEFILILDVALRQNLSNILILLVNWSEVILVSVCPPIGKFEIVHFGPLLKEDKAFPEVLQLILVSLENNQYSSDLLGGEQFS